MLAVMPGMPLPRYPVRSVRYAPALGPISVSPTACYDLGLVLAAVAEKLRSTNHLTKPPRLDLAGRSRFKLRENPTEERNNRLLHKLFTSEQIIAKLWLIVVYMGNGERTQLA